MINDIAEKYYIPKNLNENSIVIDGGAYIGEWTQYVLDKYKCKIFAVEAFPQSVDKLFLRFSNEEKVTVVEGALYNWDDKATLFPNVKSNKADGYSLCRGDSNHGVMIKTLQLQTLIEQHHIDCIDLLKLNIEGAEYFVLMDLTFELANRIKCICFASHERDILSDTHLKAMICHLKKIGYVVRKHTSKSWGESFYRWVAER